MGKREGGREADVERERGGEGREAERDQCLFLK